MTIEQGRFLPHEVEIRRRGGKPSEFRVPMLEFLHKYQDEYPYRIVQLREAADVVGCSKEMARLLYDEFSSLYELPPRTGHLETQKKYLDPAVLELYRGDCPIEAIADLTGLSIRTVRNSLIRSGEKIPTKKEQGEEINQKLLYHRNELGLGETTIMEATGLTKGVVSNRLVTLMAEGKAKRLRKKKRSKQELLRLDQEVENEFVTLSQNGKRPTYKEIAKNKNISKLDVEHALKRLRKRRLL